MSALNPCVLPAALLRWIGTSLGIFFVGMHHSAAQHVTPLVQAIQQHSKLRCH
ncbi:hypothetical protein LPH50_11450 [Xylella taiwanensis]|uniref:Uncharacterized protein n=1 Tax=Xylella taiwanensis TaxID=1444770 RepID=Z9JIS5_9GAMM|nr:hypothetical protein [Xylella taiwanensis]EWS78044.1 hypothetical protein AF72_07550 [Xylella taiwanensis]MCD8456539.1 hypothetical protein [Xylella taiwanensis]MCD8458946.1 hypothetical protein [Xylella taiwanensis]MCD8461084.1 hypothetical protein [Xylella taiwanensis]MCD8462857.1 hypothetical protein [Xylella taiwanensis]